MKIAVPKETAPGERRVALVPDTVGRLTGSGLEVAVETGAGEGAWFTDDAYREAGASVVGRDELYAGADIVVHVRKPSPDEAAAMRGRGHARRVPRAA